MKLSLRRAFPLLLLAHPVVAAETPRPVRVQTVQFVPQVVQATYVGTVQARVQASLGFRVGGKIIAREVNIGDHVSAGQVLARLDPADLRLAAAANAQAVRAAEAEAVKSRADFERYQLPGRNSRNTGKIPGDVPRQAGCPRQRTSSGSGGITAASAMSRRLP
ncbi:MAG: biotin/lipoyl-binding protein, partial [Rhodopila sp.]